MPTDVVSGPIRIQTTLRKRRPDESEPYEIIEQSSWHEPTGEEITDPARIMALETAQAIDETFGTKTHVVMRQKQEE